MKNKNKGFIVPVLIGIIALLAIGGGVYVYQNKKEGVPVAPVNTNVQTTNQVQQTTAQNTPVNTQPKVISASVTTNNSSQKLVGKCGLTISSVSPNERVTWPIIIKGSVDIKSTGGSDCVWQTWEGVAGTAQFYIYLDEENHKGWKSIGDSVIMNLEKSTTEKSNFTVAFNFTEGGFKMNAPIKIIFTEENPAVIRPSLTFELPLILK